jgi:putative ABC transport system substrate-binding protein
MAVRIVRGEKPSHIPVDQAAQIESVLNLRTAEAFGWKVPPAALLHFTEVVR